MTTTEAIKDLLANVSPLSNNACILPMRCVDQLRVAFLDDSHGFDDSTAVSPTELSNPHVSIGDGLAGVIILRGSTIRMKRVTVVEGILGGVSFDVDFGEVKDVVLDLLLVRDIVLDSLIVRSGTQIEIVVNKQKYDVRLLHVKSLANGMIHLITRRINH